MEGWVLSHRCGPDQQRWKFASLEILDVFAPVEPIARRVDSFNSSHSWIDKRKDEILGDQCVLTVSFCFGTQQRWPSMVPDGPNQRDIITGHAWCDLEL